MGFLERPDNWAAAVMVFAAAWRLTHLLAYEVGPWRVLTHLRQATGVIHDEDGRPIGYPEDNVFECFWCLSIWVAIVMVVLALWAWPVVAVLAISAFAIGIEMYGKSRN